MVRSTSSLPGPFPDLELQPALEDQRLHRHALPVADGPDLLVDDIGRHRDAVQPGGDVAEHARELRVVPVRARVAFSVHGRAIWDCPARRASANGVSRRRNRATS